MTIDEFLKKHKLALEPSHYRVCIEGIRIMGKGIDPHHDTNHISNLFEHLDHLLTLKPAIKAHIHFPTLIPAICWHDVWISKQVSRNILELLINQFVEGRKSAGMWIKYSKNKLPIEQINKIHYCIRKHSSFQFIPNLTLEAKILCDLDKLELWNIKRFLKKSNTLVSHKALYSKYIVRLYYHYSWYVGLNFAELNHKLKLLRNNFWSELK